RNSVVTPFPTRRSSDLGDLLYRRPGPFATRHRPGASRGRRTYRARSELAGRILPLTRTAIGVFARLACRSERENNTLRNCASPRSEEHTSELQSRGHLV